MHEKHKAIQKYREKKTKQKINYKGEESLGKRGENH